MVGGAGGAGPEERRLEYNNVAAERHLLEARGDERTRKKDAVQFANSTPPFEERKTCPTTANSNNSQAGVPTHPLEASNNSNNSRLLLIQVHLLRWEDIHQQVRKTIVTVCSLYHAVCQLIT